MRSISVNTGSIFLLCFIIFFGDRALSNNVVKSIVPPTQIFEFTNENAKKFASKKNSLNVSVESSVRPKFRFSTGVLIDNLSTSVIMSQNKPKNKKVSRVYIMGNSVPIFKSVIPRTRPL
mgnify:FL=1